MKEKVKLSLVYSNHPVLPDEANPRCEKFDPAGPGKFIEGNLDRMLRFMEEAGRQGVDLVCTHEDFKGGGHYLTYLDDPQIFKSTAEEIPGPTSRKMGEIARKYGMYVVPNYYEKDGDKIYNTSVLIGRDGEIVGKYRKVHLPGMEKWGCEGGKELPVFDTDIGRIGFAICYDIMFPEHCRSVALLGADIIIHQTVGWGLDRYETGEALIRVRSAENAAYIVAAKDIRTIKGCMSCITNNYGDLIAKESGTEEKIVSAEFIPDYNKLSNHFEGFFAGVSSIRARLALEREPSVYSVITAQSPSLLDRYEGIELQDSPEQIKEVYRKWKEYEDDIKNNRPVKIKYTWER